MQWFLRRDRRTDLRAVFSKPSAPVTSRNFRLSTRFVHCRSLGNQLPQEIIKPKSEWYAAKAVAPAIHSKDGDSKRLANYLRSVLGTCTS
jgi:hypothetical protein